MCDESGTAKLDRLIEDLTIEDAGIVAEIYMNSNGNTRSGILPVVKNIIPIKDFSGKVSLYAVNFSDGYILISASTNYYPIVADVPHGSFSVEEMNKFGQSVLIEEYSKAISEKRKEEHDWKFKSMWDPYFVDDAKKRIVPRTKATDVFYAELDDFLWSVKDPCTTVTLLKNCKNSIPKELYDKYVSIAESEDKWEGTEFSWENTAYVVRYETPETLYPSDPFITTTWNQGWPYNSTGYDNLGCVTIAVGQLMKYYGLPTSINWNAMPNNTANDVLRDFLKNLRTELLITSDGKGTNERTLQVLRNYGYNCSMVDHNMGKLMSYLIYDMKPVYAYGADLRDKDNRTAHAWVIDGCTNTDRYVKYSLYVLSPRDYPDFSFVTADDCGNDMYFIQNGVTSFHMNWGWGGSHDGWYTDSNMTTSVGSFSSNRKEIYFY